MAFVHTHDVKLGGVWLTQKILEYKIIYPQGQLKGKRGIFSIKITVCWRRKKRTFWFKDIEIGANEETNFTLHTQGETFEAARIGLLRVGRVFWGIEEKN